MGTVENNKLIAEFMGWKQQTNPTERWFNHWFNTEGKRQSDLFFDFDWNDLMQVIEKIESLDHCQIDISLNWCRIGYKGTLFNYDSRDYFKGITKIEAVYNACVEFIKWYNQIK